MTTYEALATILLMLSPFAFVGLFMVLDLLADVVGAIRHARAERAERMQRIAYGRSILLARMGTPKVDHVYVAKRAEFVRQLAEDGLATFRL